MLQSDRGFSLLLGLMLIVVMAIVGSTTFMFATSEAGTAGARSMRRQSQAAAEAGLHHFMGLNQPATPAANGYFIGSDGTADADFQWLPSVTAQNGNTVEPRYRVRRVTPAWALPANSILVESTGEAVVDGGVASTTVLHAIVEATPGSAGGPTEQGQKSTGPLGGSSTVPIVSNISLMFQ